MRFLLLAAALSISALTGLFRADLPARHAFDLASCEIGSQPAPESEPPAIVRAPATTAVNAPAPFVPESGRLQSVRRVVAASCRLPDVPDRRSSPRPFPLLI